MGRTERMSHVRPSIPSGTVGQDGQYRAIGVQRVGRSEGTFCVCPSVPSGTVGGDRQGLGRT